MVAPNRGWQGTGNITNTTAVVLKTAEPAQQNYIESLQIQNKHATVATVLQILAGAVVIWQANLPAVGLPQAFVFKPPLKSGVNTALSFNNVTTGSDTLCNAQGFTGQ